MIDLGKERKVPAEPEGDYPVASESKDLKMRTIIDYPNLHLESDELPGIQGVGFGQTIKLTFVAKVTGIRKQEWNGGKICYDFDLLQGDAVPMKEQKTDNKATTDDVSAMSDTKKSGMDMLDMGEAVVPDDAPEEE